MRITFLKLVEQAHETPGQPNIVYRKGDVRESPADMTDERAARYVANGFAKETPQSDSKDERASEPTTASPSDPTRKKAAARGKGFRRSTATNAE